MSRSQDAICNLIRAQRKYNRLNMRQKHIAFFMFFEKNTKINTVTKITVNVKTGNVSVAGCIRVGRTSIFPGINGKQNCNDPVFVETISEKINAIKLERYHLNKEKINARRRELREKTRQNLK